LRSVISVEIAQIPALISTKNLNGDITMVNKGFEVLADSAPELFVGKNVYDLFPKDVANQLWENDLAARKGPIKAEEIVAHKKWML